MYSETDVILIVACSSAIGAVIGVLIGWLGARKKNEKWLQAEFDLGMRTGANLARPYWGKKGIATPNVEKRKKAENSSPEREL